MANVIQYDTPDQNKSQPDTEHDTSSLSTHNVVQRDHNTQYDFSQQVIGTYKVLLVASTKGYEEKAWACHGGPWNEGSYGHLMGCWQYLCSMKDKQTYISSRGHSFRPYTLKGPRHKATFRHSASLANRRHSGECGYKIIGHKFLEWIT